MTASTSSRTVLSANSIELGPIKRFIPGSEVKDPSLSAGMMCADKARGARAIEGAGNNPQLGFKSFHVLFIK